MTTADARSVYIAFSHDRFEVVLAAQLSDAELAEANDPLPIWVLQYDVPGS